MGETSAKRGDNHDEQNVVENGYLPRLLCDFDSELSKHLKADHNLQHSSVVDLTVVQVVDGLEVLRRLTHLKEISSAGFIDSSMFIEMDDMAPAEPDEDCSTPQVSAISDKPEESRRQTSFKDFQEDDDEESKVSHISLSLF